MRYWNFLLRMRGDVRRGGSGVVCVVGAPLWTDLRPANRFDEACVPTVAWRTPGIVVHQRAQIGDHSRSSAPGE